jgi:hypothetical protein
MNEMLNVVGVPAVGCSALLGVMVVMALGWLVWRARRWSAQAILWTQAVIMVLFAVVQVENVSIWTLQERLLKYLAPTTQSFASTNPAASLRPTGSGTVAPPSRGVIACPAPQTKAMLREPLLVEWDTSNLTPCLDYASSTIGRVFCLQMFSHSYDARMTPNEQKLSRADRRVAPKAR